MIEQILGAATRLLASKNDAALVTIVVNSRPEVIEATDHDNWDGGTTGHTLRLHTPERIFYEHVANRGPFEDRLRDVIGDVARIPGEYISECRHRR